MLHPLRGASLFAATLALFATSSFGASISPGFRLSPQEAAPDATDGRVLTVEPAELVMEVGGTEQLNVSVVDADGQPVDATLMFFSRSRKSVSVGREDGLVTARKPGSFEIIIRERLQEAGENQEGRAQLTRLSGTVKVTVNMPKLESIVFGLPMGGPYVGTSIVPVTQGMDKNGAELEGLAFEWTSSDPALASFDSFGELTLHAPGSAVLSASAEGMTTELPISVRPNPVTKLALGIDNESPRTGDVVHLHVDAMSEGGDSEERVPVDVTFKGRPIGHLAPAASGQIEAEPTSSRDWRFVAELPGRYTFTAVCGGVVARRTIEVTARDVQGKFTLVGHAPVRDTHTSDLWVFEGTDGRDYAVTGTWGANGDAHFWDVTDPANMVRVATVNIDARTVNDVKVSADGRTCILSREGASNRKNGIVIVDVTDPTNPEIKSGFDENLTGGVHNVFIDGNKVYALSAGARYDSIDISDPVTPRRVGSYKVDEPSPSIHDVWVEDGLAYSSNWSDGVHIVDVGNGMAGGSPDSPVKVSSYAYPSGWNHAAFPFRQADTGRFYVAAGDEAFPNGLNLTGKPTYPRGWIHFIDFTNLDQPKETARYQVPEAGTHNLWVEDDIMYVAYYNAGLRAVDVSGELMGDIYRQGREIAWFLPDDPEGYVANGPMAWGPQPHKGHIFFSDWNSGLWAVKLER